MPGDLAERGLYEPKRKLIQLLSAILGKGATADQVTLLCSPSGDSPLLQVRTAVPRCPAMFFDEGQKPGICCAPPLTVRIPREPLDTLQPSPLIVTVQSPGGWAPLVTQPVREHPLFVADLTDCCTVVLPREVFGTVGELDGADEVMNPAADQVTRYQRSATRHGLFRTEVQQGALLVGSQRWDGLGLKVGVLLKQGGQTIARVHKFLPTRDGFAVSEALCAAQPTHRMRRRPGVMKRRS